MNSKWAPYILIALMLVALILVRRCNQGNVLDSNSSIKDRNLPVSPGKKKVNRDRGFDRRTSWLEYNSHATCRMKCREISKAEVEEVMLSGKINYNKSELHEIRCPRYALEWITKDKQRVRIIFAQCNEKTIVVTAIDLDSDYPCDCPGDVEKYKNRR